MSLIYSAEDSANYIIALEGDDKIACTSALQRFTRGMATGEYGSIQEDLEEATTLIERGKGRFESQSGVTTRASQDRKISPPPTVPESEGPPAEQAQSADQQPPPSADRQSHTDTLTQG
jgi:hypothetical protein